jgi:hypothetical protein
MEEAPLLQAAALLHTLLNNNATTTGTLSPAARETLGQLGARLLSLASPPPAAAATAMAVDGGEQDTRSSSSSTDIALVLPSPVLLHIVGFLLTRKPGASNTYSDR